MPKHEWLPGNFYLIVTFSPASKTAQYFKILKFQALLWVGTAIAYSLIRLTSVSKPAALAGAVAANEFKSKRSVFMNAKIKTMVFGSLIAGSLLMAAGPAMGHDYRGWSERDRRWSRRAELRSDYRELARARHKLEYDRARHAPRWIIAQDLARIRQIENEIRADRRALNRY
jgi:hypothetical protein